MKKGFTLIELLSVVTIISVLLIGSVIGLGKLNTDKKQEAYDNIVDIIVGAASEYFNTYSYKYDHLTEDANELKVYVTLKELVKADLIDEVTNPKTKKIFKECSFVKVYLENGIKIFKFIESNEETCVNME